MSARAASARRPSEWRLLCVIPLYFLCLLNPRQELYEQSTLKLRRCALHPLELFDAVHVSAA